MNPALNRGLKKAGRTIIQMVASGGMTALVNALAHGLDPTAQLAVAAAWMWLVTFLQNAGETKGIIPILLPTPGLITKTAGGLVDTTVGVVDTVAVGGGQVVGDVIDTTGKVVGGIAGTATGLLKGVTGVVEDVETGEGI